MFAGSHNQSPTQTAAEVNEWERRLKPTETEVNIQDWGLGLCTKPSRPTRVVWCSICVAELFLSLPCRYGSYNTVWLFTSVRKAIRDNVETIRLKFSIFQYCSLQMYNVHWSAIDLVTVFDAILTSRQTREKLQCLYENLMSNNFRITAFLKKI